MIGEGNRFAHAAALAVAELPAQAYNPLFLHGPPGLGKTHLLHAIGNYVQRFGAACASATPRSRSSPASSWAPSARAAPTTSRSASASADVVLIDDVQFLAGRTRTREEFFHTFNALLDSGRQLVLTSDRAPEELAGPRGPPVGALPLRARGRARAARAPTCGEAILAKRARLDGVEHRPPTCSPRSPPR